MEFINRPVKTVLGKRRRFGLRAPPGDAHHQAVTPDRAGPVGEPTDGRTWLALGEAFYQLGRLTEARAALCLARFNDGPRLPIEFALARVAEIERCRIQQHEERACG